MRTAVYGCGAMGTVLGAFLTKGGIDVDMIDIYEAHVNKLNEVGAKLVGFEDQTIRVHALTPDKMEGIYDLIILLCKQTANPEAFKTIAPHLNENSTILTIQNGVPEPSVAKVFGEDRVCGGTILWGATFIEPGVSEVTEPIAKKPELFEIGTISGEINDRIKLCQKVLSAMGPTVIVENLMAARWTKVLLNSAMSGMSAALGCTFGDVLDCPKAMDMIGEICYEAGRVNEAAGMTFAPVLGIDVNTAMKQGVATKTIASKQIFPAGYANMRTAKASMLQDLEKGKITEVDMINGFICDEGRRVGIETPVNDKVREVVHGIEQGKYPLNMSNIDLF